MTDRDWRKTAYLKRENWPEAIPNSGPKREHGPYPWGNPTHDDEHGLDQYPTSHPDAASISTHYMGDVCPFCGVPIHYKDDRVVTLDGEEGTLQEIEDDPTDPEPARHRDCYYKRQNRVNSTLDEWVLVDE